MVEVSATTGGGPLVWQVARVAETGSTNADLLAAARRGAPAGSVLVADHQTAGRGRLGRVWQAPPGASLLVSILFRPGPGPTTTDLQRCTQAVAVAAARACEEVAGFAPDLKWPNDLLAGGRKLAGILSEASAAPGGGVDAVVVGLGLNVQWPGELPEDLAGIAVAANQVAGRAVDREAVLDALLRHLAALDPATVDAEYRRRLVTLGQRVRVERPAGLLVGEAVGLGDGGELLVRDDTGQVHQVSVGDVTHLRQA